MKFNYEKKNYCHIYLYRIPNSREIEIGAREHFFDSDIYIEDRDVEMNSSKYWELLKTYSHLLKRLSEIDHEYYRYYLVIE